METIIIKSKHARKTKALLDFLKKNKMSADVIQEQDKDDILNSIERGAKEAAAFIKGKKKLRNAKDLLREL